MKKFFLITGVLFFIGICVTVFLWFKVRDAKISYNKIMVSVVSVEKIMPKDARETMKYRVKVRYDGTDRELNNVKKGFSYFAGQQVEVFESDGILYEEEDGIFRLYFRRVRGGSTALPDEAPEKGKAYLRA